MLKLLTIPLVSFLLVVVNYLVVKSTGSQAWVSEVTQYGNIQRCLDIQKADENSTIIVGSSIAGRLIPPFFQKNNVYNLGIDSGTTTAGLKFLKEKKIHPKTLIIELNRLDMAGIEKTLDQMKNEYGKKTSLSSKLSLFQPNYRPSSVVYHRVKAIVDQRIDARSTSNLKSSNTSILNPDITKEAEIKASKNNIPSEIRELLIYFKDHGTRLIFIDVPSDNQSLPEIKQFAENWVKQGMATYIKRSDLGDKKMTYSDGTHLTLTSAERYAHEISNSL